MSVRKDPTTSINLRLPAEMVETLRKMAEADERSLNSTVYRMLRETVAKRGL